MTRQPIRIANASGAIGDGIDQIYRLAVSGEVDAITADYLAEFNIAWKAIELQTAPHLGFEPNFLEQLAWQNGDAAKEVFKRGIKVVHNGGALNPEGLATAVYAYFEQLGMSSIKVAWVTGDNLTARAKTGQLTTFQLLESHNESFNVMGEHVLAVNAYIGQDGIVRALEEGADIVVCGRCCDASPVMGLATWWHNWNPSQIDQLAGALMAGHLIECGAYVTGGNFCGQQEVASLFSVGYPVAEIASDGTSVITKPRGTNGAVTLDTCKAQLLYEIQGTKYLNPDVVAVIQDARLDEVGRDRIKLSGIRGLAPPETAKVAICLLGGYQAELYGFCVGLDTDFKFALMKEQIMRRLELSRYITVSIEKYGSSPPDPASQAKSTVMIRLFVQALTKDAIYDFRRAIFYNGMQGYCGLHLAMDWRTLEPRHFVKYVPALVKQDHLNLTVHFVQSASAFNVDNAPSDFTPYHMLAQEHKEPSSAAELLSCSEDVVMRPLGDLVFARSGDKGPNANVGFWVRDVQIWPWLRAFMTSSRIISLLGEDWKDHYTVERCELEQLWAVHFVVKGILQAGVSSSSIIDGFAKSFGEFLRARHVLLPRKFVEEEDVRRQRLIQQAQTVSSSL